MLRIKVLH